MYYLSNSKVKQYLHSYTGNRISHLILKVIRHESNHVPSEFSMKDNNAQ